MECRSSRCPTAPAQSAIEKPTQQDEPKVIQTFAKANLKFPQDTIVNTSMKLT